MHVITRQYSKFIWSVYSVCKSGIKQKEKYFKYLNISGINVPLSPHFLIVQYTSHLLHETVYPKIYKQQHHKVTKLHKFTIRHKSLILTASNKVSKSTVI